MPKVTKDTYKRVAGAKCEYSKVSQYLFKRLLDYIPDQENVNFATHKIQLPSGEWLLKGEFKLHNKFFDFRYRNNLIEFSSNFYHCDPRIYSASSIVLGRAAQDIWELDKEKAEIAKKEGFRLLVIWEDSYLKNPSLVVEKCVNFLLEDQKVGAQNESIVTKAVE